MREREYLRMCTCTCVLLVAAATALTFISTLLSLAASPSELEPTSYQKESSDRQTDRWTHTPQPINVHVNSIVLYNSIVI